MKAYVRVDPQDQTVVPADVERPSPGPDEVSVEVQAFGVGVHDRQFISPSGPFPYVIGLEAAGVVGAVGQAVSGVDVGDRVMVSTIMNPKGGTWAEHAVVAQGGVTPIPDDLDFVSAAAIPIAGDAAVETMHTLDMRRGQTLFVAGASGAIGTLVIQMAVRAGIRVAGSASADNADYLRTLGAELAVDYRDSTWPEQIRDWASGGVDAALAIQPGTPGPSIEVVHDGGHLVAVSGDPCPPQREIRVEQFPHRADTRDDMARLVGDIAVGRLHLEIERVYPFAEALSALDKTETRHAKGKVVVAVDGGG